MFPFRLARLGYTWTNMTDTPSALLDADLAAYLAGEWNRFGDAGDQRDLLQLLHGLATGAPVPRADVADAVAGLPPAWLEAGDDDNLIGFGGLTQAETRHRLDIDGRTLHAWCAFDCLFLPALLGRTIAVASTCPSTGTPITLTVSPDAIEACAPANTVVSFVLPDEASRRQSLRQVFCAHINFFACTEAADHWLATAEGGRILDLETAFDLARQRNAAAFGAGLET